MGKEFLIQALNDSTLESLAETLQHKNQFKQNQFEFICKTTALEDIHLLKETIYKGDEFLILDASNGVRPDFGAFSQWMAKIYTVDEALESLEKEGLSYLDGFKDSPFVFQGKEYRADINEEFINNESLFPDEKMNRSIVESVVNDHIENMEDWALSESGGLIILEREGEEQNYSSYASVLKEIGQSIEEDLYNHQEYLSMNQLQYLKGQGMDIPDFIEGRESSLKSEQPRSTETKQQVITPQIATKIENQLSILDVVRDAGYNLKRNGTTSYTTEEHNSLVLDTKSNRFFWNSKPPREEDVKKAQARIEKTGKGTIPQCLSGGVITFYMIEHNVSYKKAVSQLAKKVDLHLEIPEIKKSENSKKTMSPMERHRFLQKQLRENHYQNTDMKNVKAYLIKTRKIDQEIVDLFIERKMLVQTQDEKGRTQAAFLGKDENGYLSYVNFRSTSSVSKFKGDYSGCNYDRGCFFEPEFDVPLGWKDDPKKQPINANKRLLVFESNIEMMSYMSLLKLNGNNYKNFAYLSCGSIAKSNCVLETCKTYGYNKVVVMFNNDKEKKNNPGLTKANYVSKQLQKEGIDAHPLVPSKCNDWNDTLIAFKDKLIELNQYKEKPKQKGISR